MDRISKIEDKTSMLGVQFFFLNPVNPVNSDFALCLLS